MTLLASVLPILAGAGFILIGTAAIFHPAVLSHLYGTYVHEPNGRAFVRAAGVRDVAFGILILALALDGSSALRMALIIAAVIALGDFTIVLKANKAFERGPLMGHLAGFAFLILSATFVGMANLSR